MGELKNAENEKYIFGIHAEKYRKTNQKSLEKVSYAFWKSHKKSQKVKKKVKKKVKQKSQKSQ